MDTTREIVRAYMDALMNNGDFGPYMADDVVFKMVDVGMEIRGRQDVVAAIVNWHQETFDAKIEMAGMMVAGEQAVAELVFVATQMDVFLGIPATGRSVRAPYSAFYEVRDGKIAEVRVYGVIPTIVMQLTADQAPAATTQVS